MAEAWLRGPLEGFQPVVMPAAFALVQSREEIEGATAGLTREQLWASPGGGAASIGYHLRHLVGSTDRLLTYAHGAQLSPEQMTALEAEKAPVRDDETAARLTAMAAQAIDRALAELRAIDPAEMHAPRTVGRARVPVTLYVLLCHIAEHTTRHAAQIVTTAKIVRAPRP